MARKALAAIAALLPAMPLAAAGQDFPDAQSLSNRVLFAREDVAAARRVAERRRIEELDARATQQAVLLQEQARSVRELGGELRTLKDERELIELANSFDAALATGRWAAARSLLAAEVAVDLGRPPGAPVSTVAADALVSTLSQTLVRGGVLPRSNQRIGFDADHATVSSEGYAWGPPGRSPQVLEQQFGRYEYRYLRTAEGWKIDGLAFRPALPS